MAIARSLVSTLGSILWTGICEIWNFIVGVLLLFACIGAFFAFVLSFHFIFDLHMWWVGIIDAIVVLLLMGLDPTCRLPRGSYHYRPARPQKDILDFSGEDDVHDYKPYERF